MSYDMHLYRRSNPNESITLAELDKLRPVFKIKDINNKDGVIISFDLAYPDDNSGFYKEFVRQEDGGYWAYVSYGIGYDKLLRFKEFVKKAAQLLDFQIKDPQISNELIDALDYDVGNDKSQKAFNFVNNELMPNLPLMIPSKSMYFILYIIESTNPMNFELLRLEPKNYGVIGSKVKPNEALLEVINREILEITGSNKYKLLGVINNFDTAHDRNGNEITRTAVAIHVPYFDPEKTKTQFPVKWVKHNKS